MKSETTNSLDTYKPKWDSFLEAYSKILKENNELREQIDKLKMVRSIRG